MLDLAHDRVAADAKAVGDAVVGSACGELGEDFRLAQRDRQAGGEQRRGQGRWRRGQRGGAEESSRAIARARLAGGGQAGGEGGVSLGSEASSAGEGAGVFFDDELATLTMTRSTLNGNRTGAGGDGGSGGTGGAGGGEGGGGGSVGLAGSSAAGSAGDSGAGSAIAIWGGSLGGTAANISWSTLTGNANGDGGTGGAGGAGPVSSRGENGGAALDGAVEVGLGAGNVALSHLTVDANTVGSPGAGGDAGGGTTSHAGSPGEAAEGGGIEGPATLIATIVSGNAGEQCVADMAGFAIDGGFDLSFPDGTCPGTDGDPKLAALAANGGPTETQQLLQGSAAIGAIPVGASACAGSDQRGFAIAQGGACDIGAYETEALPADTGTPGGGATAPVAKGGAPHAHAAFAGLKIGRQKVRLSAKGVASIRVTCPAATTGRCKGRLTLASKAKRRGGKRGERKRKAMKLGSVSFSIAAGAHATLRVRLSKRARMLVTHARRLVATATALTRDGLGRSTTTRAQIRLRPGHSR